MATSVSSATLTLTLVYKMTHSGDPDTDLGWWGDEECDCMGEKRGLWYEAVIGFGGRSWYSHPDRAEEVVWVGIGPDPREVPGHRGPQVRFDHFRHFQPGELLLPPNLAAAMYDKRLMRDGFNLAARREIESILELARDAPPSAGW